MKYLLRLYPAAWRGRYEDEFLALLDERPLSPFDVFDIALGALDARLRPGDLAIEFAGRRNDPMNARFAGWAAVVGGVLFLIAMSLGTLLPYPQNELAAPIYPLAAVALLAALVGLSAVQGRRRPVLVWAAVAVPVCGLLLSLVGVGSIFLRGDASIIGEFAGWHLWMAGLIALIVGSVLFAVATLMVGVFSRAGAVALLVGAAMLAILFTGAVGGLLDPTNPLFIPLDVSAMLLFGGGWVWLGYAAATRRAIVTQPGPA